MPRCPVCWVQFLSPVADVNAVVHVLSLVLTVWIMAAAINKLRMLTIFAL